MPTQNGLKSQRQKPKSHRQSKARGKTSQNSSRTRTKQNSLHKQT